MAKGLQEEKKTVSKGSFHLVYLSAFLIFFTAAVSYVALQYGVFNYLDYFLMKDNLSGVNDLPIANRLTALESIIKTNPKRALKHYNTLLSTNPNSPRALFGKGISLCQLAAVERSNARLEECIKTFQDTIKEPSLTSQLLVKVSRDFREKAVFRGWTDLALKTLSTAAETRPDDVFLYNEVGICYLYMGRSMDAKKAFSKVLEKRPNDGVALGHMGFIVATSDDNAKGAIPLLKAGIESGEPEIQKGNFYYQLSFAYIRIGEIDEAHKVNVAGSAKGIFPSAEQRSLYNVDGLVARPWWTHKQTGYENYLKILEDNWELIRDEGLRMFDSSGGYFSLEGEGLTDFGDWRQFTLYSQGKKNLKNCALVPKVCAVLDKLKPSIGCKRGQIKYSVMLPGLHVWPHVGPTNCRIRSHLGLKIPSGVKMRVGKEAKTWQEGKVLVFDDSFEHEVWHNGTEVRLILISDFWHPSLTEDQRRTLSPI